MKLEKHFFGITADGDRADLYRLSNDAGMDLAITNYGAAVVELCVPDRDGNRADVASPLTRRVKRAEREPHIK